MNIKRVLPAGQRPFLYIQVNCSTWNNRVMNKTEIRQNRKCSTWNIGTFVLKMTYIISYINDRMSLLHS